MACGDVSGKARIGIGIGCGDLRRGWVIGLKGRVGGWVIAVLFIRVVLRSVFLSLFVSFGPLQVPKNQLQIGDIKSYISNNPAVAIPQFLRPSLVSWGFEIV